VGVALLGSHQQAAPPDSGSTATPKNGLLGPVGHGPPETGNPWRHEAVWWALLGFGQGAANRRIRCRVCGSRSVEPKGEDRAGPMPWGLSCSGQRACCRRSPCGPVVAGERPPQLGRRWPGNAGTLGQLGMTSPFRNLAFSAATTAADHGRGRHRWGRGRPAAGVCQGNPRGGPALLPPGREFRAGDALNLCVGSRLLGWRPPRILPNGEARTRIVAPLSSPSRERSGRRGPHQESPEVNKNGAAASKARRSWESWNRLKTATGHGVDQVPRFV